MRTHRQDYVSIRLFSGCSILRRILALAAIWICPMAIRNCRRRPTRSRNVMACGAVPLPIRYGGKSGRRANSADAYSLLSAPTCHPPNSLFAIDCTVIITFYFTIICGFVFVFARLFIVFRFGLIIIFDVSLICVILIRGLVLSIIWTAFRLGESGKFCTDLFKR